MRLRDDEVRRIPPKINIDVHLGQIAKAWNKFKKPYLKPGAQSPTKDSLLKFATDIDDLHGMKFEVPGFGVLRIGSDIVIKIEVPPSDDLLGAQFDPPIRN